MIGALFLASACAGANRPARVATEENQPMPLAGLVAQPLIVVPAHYLKTGDAIGWSRLVPDPRAYLAAFDSALERVFKSRGTADIWKFPPDLVRAAQRNAGYLANPYQLAAQGLRPPARSNASQLTDPLASQIRAMAAVQGGTVALIPVEIRFEGMRDSAQAVVRVAVLNARLARVSWAADVRSDRGASPTAVLESLARHVADLALPR